MVASAASAVSLTLSEIGTLAVMGTMVPDFGGGIASGLEIDAARPWRTHGRKLRLACEDMGISKLHFVGRHELPAGGIAVEGLERRAVLAPRAHRGRERRGRPGGARNDAPALGVYRGGCGGGFV